MKRCRARAHTAVTAVVLLLFLNGATSNAADQTWTLADSPVVIATDTTTATPSGIIW